MKYDRFFGKKKMKIISIQRNLWQACKFDSHRRIHMAQSSEDGKSSFQPAADQFRPLQSVFRRRLITGVGAASLLSVGANFCGITSFLLSFSPEEARHLKLDALYPVRGYSRYIDTYIDGGFEFIYPESWLGDQTIAYRAAEKVERLMDPPPVGRRPRSVSEPVVAYGPPGSTGELNVSVIVAPVPLDFSIEAFGGAEEVGEAILGTITRRSRGSDEVKGTLIDSSLREDSSKGVKFYKLEFEVESPTFHRHNVAVCCVRKGRLFTLNAQSPESAWPKFKSQFYTIADSFSLV